MANKSRIVLDIGQGLSLLLGLPSIAYWSTDDRPKVARAGTLGFNTDTGSLEFWDGDNWYVASMEVSPEANLAASQ